MTTKMPYMNNRRSFLKGIGAAMLVGGFGTASAAGDDSGDDNPRPLASRGPGNDDGLPVYADGITVGEYQRDLTSDGEFTLERRFKSQDLDERYGDSVFEFKPVTLREEQVPEKAKTGEKTSYTQSDQRVVGTVEEHLKAEQKIWKEHTNGLQALDVPDIERGVVPLYHYDPSANGDYYEVRSSPMNLAWEAEESQDVQDTMQNNGWNTALQNIEEYTVDKKVNLPDGGVKSTDAHVMDKITGTLDSAICQIETVQWHIRLYDVPADGIDAIGQAHRDPCDHGKALGGMTDWHMNKARSETADFWDDVDGVGLSYQDVGNTATSNFDSHDGWWRIFKDL